MALSVTSDLTVITNGNDGTWGDIGGGGGSAAEPDYFVQGTGCRSRAVSNALRGMSTDIQTNIGGTLDFSSGGTEEDQLFYIWIQDYTPGLTETVANAPGLTIRLGDGTTEENGNIAEWDVIYSDLLTPPGTEFFRIYVLDPRAPPTRTVTGTWNSTAWGAIRWVGARLNIAATAKGQNLAIDRVCYGFGELKVTGTATNETSGFQEIIDETWNTIDDSVAINALSQSRNGIFSVRGSTAFVKGKIIIGDDAGTTATTFTGTDGKIEFEDTLYYDGTRVRSAVGYDQNQNYTGRRSDGSTYYGIKFVGNATGDTNITFGRPVGTDRGRSGGSITGALITPTDIIGDDGSVESMSLYGVTFDSFRSLDFSSNASTDLLRSCNIVRCGTLDSGPVEGRNNSFINGIGGAYTFLESFYNPEATVAEALATADPTTEWTALLNGADLSIPEAGSFYVELLGGTARTNVVLFDDEKVGTAANHYVSCVISFPSGGASQGTLGPVIAGVGGTENYFYMDVDLLNDQVSLIRVNTGTDTTIAGPTSFTMDEDEEYVVLLRRNGTAIEGFISGNSVADGDHTTKISATDSAFSTQYITGIRGDAAAGQTGDAPRLSQFGTGPITDNLGAIIYPAAGSVDFSNIILINCRRGLSFDTTGTYTLNNTALSGNIIDAHNDSGGSVTGSITGNDGTVPVTIENLDSSTSTFTADYEFKIENVRRYSEVRIYEENPTTGDRTEVAGVETLDHPTPIGVSNFINIANTTDGEFFEATYVHGGNWGNVVIVAMGDPIQGATRYQYYKADYELSAANESFQVQQILDRNKI